MATAAITFRKLSQTTTVYEPPAGTIGPSDAPNTILVVGWMGGTTRNLSRYTTRYNTLFPATRIILVTSALTDTPGFKALLSPTELKQRTETPATLLAHSKSSEDRLLIHAFSNGGGMNLAAITRAYQLITRGPMPARAVILDSLPGGDSWPNEFGRWVKAIAFGLPSNPLIRWPGQVLIALMVAVLLVLPSLFGFENAATKARRELNDEGLIDKRAKRLYIYSDADPLIGAREVLEHAANAAAKGFDVETVNFGDTGHVRHAISDPEKYWDAVRKTWKGSF